MVRARGLCSRADKIKNVHKANSDSKDLRENVDKVFQQVAESGTELVATQTKQWDRSQEMAIQLHGSLRDIREGEVGALVNAIYGMRDQLVSQPNYPEG